MPVPNFRCFTRAPTAKTAAVLRLVLGATRKLDGRDAGRARSTRTRHWAENASSSTSPPERRSGVPAGAVAPLAAAAGECMNERPELRTLIVLRCSSIVLGNGDEKARRLRRHELAVAPALLGVREVQLPLGARDADVEQPALLLEQGGIVVRLREREQAVLEPA